MICIEEVKKLEPKVIIKTIRPRLISSDIFNEIDNLIVGQSDDKEVD